MCETNHDSRSYGGEDLFKGMVAGALAGLAGTIVMTAFQQRIQAEMKRPIGAGRGDVGGGDASGRSRHRGQSQGESGQSEAAQFEAAESEGFASGQSGQQQPQYQEQGGQGQQQPEPATAKAADRMARTLLGHGLSEEQKQTGSQVMHYGFGTAMGTLYGAGVEYVPALTSGAGLVYGTGLFLVADEVAVPALRLSPPPTEHPPATHVSAWVAHLIYGVTVEVVRRIVRRVLC